MKISVQQTWQITISVGFVEQIILYQTDHLRKKKNDQPYVSDNLENNVLTALLRAIPS